MGEEIRNPAAWPGWSSTVAEMHREYRLAVAEDATALAEALRSEQTLQGRMSGTAGLISAQLIDGTRAQGEIDHVSDAGLVLRGPAWTWWIPVGAVVAVRGLVAAAPGDARASPRHAGAAHLGVLRSWAGDDEVLHLALAAPRDAPPVRGWLAAVGRDHLDVHPIDGGAPLTVVLAHVAAVRRPSHPQRRG